jgi:hypothetical protein
VSGRAGAVDLADAACTEQLEARLLEGSLKSADLAPALARLKVADIHRLRTAFAEKVGRSQAERAARVATAVAAGLEQ